MTRDLCMRMPVVFSCVVLGTLSLTALVEQHREVDTALSTAPQLPRAATWLPSDAPNFRKPPTLRRLRGGSVEAMDLEIDDDIEHTTKKAKNESDPQMSEWVRQLKDEMFPPIKNPPSNFVYGVFRGAGALASGVVKGAIVATTMPLAGAVQAGPMGFLAGTIVGSCSGAALATAGVMNAGRYVISGVTNTPKYCQTLAQPMLPYNLTQEAEEVSAEVDLRSQQWVGGNADLEQHRDFSKVTHVENTTYYDLLGVPINADREEIVRTYRKLAMKMHPDRFKTKPREIKKEMEEKFKKIVEAYQILSEDETRHKYNTQGHDETRNNGLDIEINILLATVFGGGKFEKYIGELQPSLFGKDLSKLLEKMTKNYTDEETPQPQLDDMVVDKFVQRKREVELAGNLAKMLDEYSYYGDVWIDNIKSEADKLNQTLHGEFLLYMIGSEYHHHANQWEGMFISRSLKRPFAKLARSTRTIRHYARIFEGLKSMVTVLRSMNLGEGEKDTQKNKGGDDELTKDLRDLFKSKAEKKPKLDADGIPIDDGEDEEKNEAISHALLKIGWNLVALDVQKTLYGVCNRVLSDVSVPRELRANRVKALQHLGHVFIKKGRVMNSTISVDSGDLRKALITSFINKRNKEQGIEDEEGEGEGEEKIRSLVATSRE